MIITTDLSKVNITKLKEKCEPVSTIEEGEEIAAKLLKELTNSKESGIGLAALVAAVFAVLIPLLQTTFD